MAVPTPDFSRLRRVLLREGEPDRVPFFEVLVDPEIMAAVMGEALPAPGGGKAGAEVFDRLAVDFFLRQGYDYVPVWPEIPLPLSDLGRCEDTAGTGRSHRLWRDQNQGMIHDWRSFYSYPWPAGEEIDYGSLERRSLLLPEGMLMCAGWSGVFEHALWLMGHQTLALTIYDDPSLVEAVFERIGRLAVAAYTAMAGMEEVGALFHADDLGFKTSTVLSPEHLRRLVFPWHRELARVAHERGKPFILHSCGNLEAVMPDLIDEVRIDARHSYEDAILPVAEAKRRHGGRIAVLGGVDMDFICRRSEEEVRAYVRRILSACAPGGGYALGTGNSVANYVPLRNYLAMLDEGRRYGR